MKRLLTWVLGGYLIAMVLGMGVAYYVLWQGAQFDDLEKLEAHKPILYSRIYDRHGQLIDILSSEQRIILEYEDIPEDFIHALVAVEDEHFFNHIGVSPFGILSAVKDVAVGRPPRGASTLTQQLVKNITKDKRYALSRKLKEQFLAVQLESMFTKEELLAMYTNEVPFGNNQFGLAAAASYYFGVNSPGQLDLVQCATLAGLPQAPSRFNPYRNPESCLRKRNIVLDRMVVEGYITPEEGKEAKQKPLELRDRNNNIAGPPVAAHFVDKVRAYVFEKYGEERVRTSGWDIVTTLDLGYQRTAEEAVRAGLKGVDKTLGYRHYDTPSVFVDQAEDVEPDLALLDDYFDPTWRQTLQDGISIRGVVMAVREDAIDVRIRDYLFPLTVENMKWVGKIKDMNKFFKVGDVPLFLVRASDEALRGVDLAAYLDDEIALLTTEEESAETPEEITDEETSETEEVAEVVPSERVLPFHLELDQEPDIEGAFYAIDVKTGDTLAMVGGYDYRRSKFNRAEQAQRQVGSAFKPMVFGAALERGYTLADTLFDEPTLFIDPTQFKIDENGEIEYRAPNRNIERRVRLGLMEAPKPYQPHNYYNRYVGEVTLRSALAQSKNIVSVKLLNSVGYDRVLDYVNRMKLHRPSLQPFPSLALGAMEMSLRDMTYAYGAYANQGVGYDHRFVTLIMDAKGRVIEENPPKGEQLVSPQNAYLVKEAMKAVVYDPKGSARRAKALKYPHFAGKTGTTNDYADAWFIGYTPTIAAGAWVGRDLKHTIGRGRSGSSTALPIWIKFMRGIQDDLPLKGYPLPEGLVMAAVDRKTGDKFTEDCDCNLSDRIELPFIQGTEPIEICSSDEQNKLNLPWYLQKRTYEFDRQEGEIKPSRVMIDYDSQQRALRLLDEIN